VSDRVFRSWAEVDSAALRHNARMLRDRIGRAELLAVIKADAYGHGMLGVAEILADEVQLFAVANLEEAITLRTAVPHPILILGPALPQEWPEIASHGFIPTISTLEEAQGFSRLGNARKVSVNFKADTGMGRMGAPEREALSLFQQLAALPQLHIHSVSSHLPVADTDVDYTRDQLARFRQLVNEYRSRVPGNYKAHVLQSAGTLGFGADPFDIVRAGIIFYGISPLPQQQGAFKPVLTWKARIGLVRDIPAGSSISYGRTFTAPKPMRVATITAGYADGYPRHLSNRDAAILVRGQRCPLLGRVTMDLMVIDVSHIPEAQAGEEVVLMGKQGEEEIPCAELAHRAGTITWEITARIGSRVRRVFL
jgi:alanine racemase